MQHFCALRLGALLLLLAVSSFNLTGCGNKGPLYLPPEAVQETSTDSASEVTDAEAAETSQSK